MYKVQEYVRGIDKWITIEMFISVYDAKRYVDENKMFHQRIIHNDKRVIYENQD